MKASSEYKEVEGGKKKVTNEKKEKGKKIKVRKERQNE